MTFLSSDRFRAFLELLRPANIITAHADILVGVAASGVLSISSEIASESTVQPFWFLYLCGLLFATSALYGGGVVLNDVFDAKLDAKEIIALKSK